MQPKASLAELECLLKDDAPNGDLTTEGLGIKDLKGEMKLTARDPMVLAEAESAAALLQLLGCGVSLDAKSGDHLVPGSAILTAQGSAGSLHKGWKLAQTLIETWSGVATAARAVVDAAKSASPDIVVACTRKNVPGTKSYAVRAVRAGGAAIHRLGLSETVLVFAQHRAFLPDKPLRDMVRDLRQAAPEQKIVVEVTSEAEALEAINAGFDVVQIDKLQPEAIAEIVAKAAVMNRPPLISAAGGINAANAADYAKSGVDVLVTSSPYFAKPRDVQVRIVPI